MARHFIKSMELTSNTTIKLSPLFSPSPPQAVYYYYYGLLLSSTVEWTCLFLTTSRLPIR